MTSHPFDHNAASSPTITISPEDPIEEAKTLVHRAMSAAIRRVVEARAYASPSTASLPSPTLVTAAPAQGHPLNYVKQHASTHHPSTHQPPLETTEGDDNPLSIPTTAPAQPASSSPRKLTAPPPRTDPPQTMSPVAHRLSFQVFVDNNDDVDLQPFHSLPLPHHVSAIKRPSQSLGSGSELPPKNTPLRSQAPPGLAQVGATPGEGEWRLPWGDGSQVHAMAPIPQPGARRESESSGTRSSTSHHDLLILPTAKNLPAVSYLSPQVLDDSGRNLRHLSVASTSSMHSETSMRFGLHVPPLFSTPGSLIATPAFRHHPSNHGGVGHVIPGTLFVGPYRAFCDAEVCAALGIKAYLCVAEEVKPGLPPHVNMGDIRGGRIGFMKLNLTDDATTSLRDHIDAAFNFVDEHVERGHPVALFCQAGKSRSVSIALAFMMREYEMTALEALASLQSQYSPAEPNIYFLAQLEALDGQLHREAPSVGYGQDDEAMDPFMFHDRQHEDIRYDAPLSSGPAQGSHSPPMRQKSPALLDLVAYSPTADDLPLPLNDRSTKPKRSKKKPTTTLGTAHSGRGRSETVKGVTGGDTSECADEYESADSRSASPSADGSIPNSPTTFKRSHAGSPKLGGSLTTAPFVPSRPPSAALGAANVARQQTTGRSPYSSPEYSPLPAMARRRRVLDV